MPEPNSPLKRPIGLSGVITFLIAVAAAITVGSAWFDGRYALAGVAAVFFVGAMLVGIRMSR
jgi:hypothetical protein